MVQIGGLRPYYNDDGEIIATPFKTNGMVYDSIFEMFENVEKDLESIPEAERYNLFYTLAHHLRNKRSFDSWQCQNVIPLDLDGIDLERIGEYPEIAAKAAGFDLSKTAIIQTGNGLHILIQVPRINDKNYIKEAKLGYKQILERINDACIEAGLPITVDSTAWDYGRIFRVPFTENRKVQKDGTVKVKRCVLIQNKLEAQDFKLPEVEKIASELFLTKGSFPLPDKSYIMKSCDFMRWLDTSPDEVHEPHAYAMLSITGNFDDDNATSARLWDKFSSPSINAKDLNEFTEQALSASGPRTCKGINALYGKCNLCPNYEKVTSPVMLKGEGYIGSAHCGFTLRGKRGGLIRQYEDLRKFYSEEKKYINIPEIKRVMIYEEGLFKKTYEEEIKGYAQKHFSPCSEKEEERRQFLFQVKSAPEHQKPLSFIHGARNEGFINLKNGVLDLSTKKLLEHSPDFGFIYKLPYDYDAGATCPTWELLLNNLTKGRKDLIDLLEEAIAYTVGNVPYTKFQHYFLLTGGGSNGKTTFINIFKMILGAQNTASIKLANLLTKEYYIAELEGKLANMVADEDPEAFEKKGADSSLLKALTGGDSVSARVIYEAPMQFVNRAKFFYAFNDIPKLGIKSHGDIRRPIILPFDVNLDVDTGAKIENIYAKIELELGGILNRIVKAHDRLMEKGFTKSNYSLESIKKSRLEHDPIYDFLVTECKIMSGKFDSYAEPFVSYEDLYNAFDRDEMYQNPNYRVTLRTFCKRVRSVTASDNEFKKCYKSKRKIGDKYFYGTSMLQLSNKAVRF